MSFIYYYAARVPQFHPRRGQTGVCESNEMLILTGFGVTPENYGETIRELP
jgi:hypothetical protein